MAGVPPLETQIAGIMDNLSEAQTEEVARFVEAQQQGGSTDSADVLFIKGAEAVRAGKDPFVATESPAAAAPADATAATPDVAPEATSEAAPETAGVPEEGREASPQPATPLEKDPEKARRNAERVRGLETETLSLRERNAKLEARLEQLEQRIAETSAPPKNPYDEMTAAEQAAFDLAEAKKLVRQEASAVIREELARDKAEVARGQFNAWYVKLTPEAFAALAAEMQEDRLLELEIAKRTDLLKSGDAKSEDYAWLKSNMSRAIRARSGAVPASEAKAPKPAGARFAAAGGGGRVGVPPLAVGQKAKLQAVTQKQVDAMEEPAYIKYANDCLAAGLEPTAQSGVV